MRILGITIPDSKQLQIGLTELYGLGRTKTREVLNQAGIEPGQKPSEITAEQEASIREQVEAMTVEGDLRREVSANIKRLRDIQSYRGLRHSRRLPCRGQRTKTNSRTRRGNTRKTMGTGRRAVEKK